MAYIAFDDYIPSSVNREQVQLRASVVIKGLGTAQLSWFWIRETNYLVDYGMRPLRGDELK